MATNLVPKSSKKFRCETCDFETSRKSQHDRHKLTAKHKMATNTTDGQQEKFQKVPEYREYNCDCGKTYLHHSSMWKHKQKCNIAKNNVLSFPIQETNSNSLMLELLKQNGEFKELIKEQSHHMMEQNKNMCEIISKVGVGNNTTTNHTNSHNTTNKNRFNINLFLNEQCKDAMNIMDFVNSLQLQLSDLEKVGEIGFVKGISNILVKNLKELDICKRPIHCSDLKRETLYVKDANTWEKENGKKEKLTKMIQHVAHKNVKQLPEWQKENPDFKDSDSIESEKYLKIVGESMGGSTEDDDIDNYNKIIKTLAKEVIIEKDNEQ
jgi:hypothetical protein